MEAEAEVGLKDLSDEELLAMAALLRLLVRLDGQFSDAEQEALQEIALDLGEHRFWKAMEDAGQRAPDEESIRHLTASVARRGARELIFGLVLGVAQSDVVQAGESSLLQWLKSEWKLDDLPGAYRE